MCLMNLFKRVVVCAVVAGALISSGALWGLQPATLPDFSLTTLEGKTVKSGELAMTGHWLLLYVNPKNRLSNEILAQLEEGQKSPAKVIVVVQAGADEARAMQSLHPSLAQVPWYADSSGSAFKTLKLHGVPVILGIDGKMMDWNINGSLQDVVVQKSIVNGWIQH
jgi:hypothetical protein